MEQSLQAFLNSFMLLGDIYKFHLSLFIRFDCYLCASALKNFSSDPGTVKCHILQPNATREDEENTKRRKTKRNLTAFVKARFCSYVTIDANKFTFLQKFYFLQITWQEILNLSCFSI